MTNTQVRIFGLKDAIDRDRAAHEHDIVAEIVQEEPIDDFYGANEDTPPWELWLALVLGLTIIVIAAVI